MFVTDYPKDFVYPIEVQLGSLRQSLSVANNESFASVIFMTQSKEESRIPFKERVDSACNVEGINPRDMHHSFSRHQVYYRAISKGSETTIDEMAAEVAEMFKTTGYKKQLFFTDLKELYEKLTGGNKEHG
jgi:hypothetical protein